MKTEFDIVLIEKPGEDGLTKSNCMDLFDMLKEPEAYPIEISNPGGESSAMGFISRSAADSIDYEYKGLDTFVGGILADMEKESDDGCYEYDNLDVYLSRE